MKRLSSTRGRQCKWVHGAKVLPGSKKRGALTQSPTALKIGNGGEGGGASGDGMGGGAGGSEGDGGGAGGLGGGPGPIMRS